MADVIPPAQAAEMTATVTQLPTQITPADRRLTAAEFQGLAEVPPEIEWFDNISNPGTRRIYENSIRDFMRFTGIVRPEEFRIVTRAHVIAWRDDLCSGSRGLERRHTPQPTGGFIVALRVSLRQECGQSQSGQRHQAPKEPERRRHDADNRRSPGAPASRGA